MHPKKWQQALRVASLRRDPKTGERYLDLMGRKVVAMALEGDKWALDHFADRIDGSILAGAAGDANVLALVPIQRIERVIVDPDPTLLRDISADVSVRLDAEDTLGASVPTPPSAPEV